MKTCPYCSVEIDEQFNFCTKCERQIKCITCGAYLFPDKSKCLVCGMSIMSVPSPSSSFNEYLFEEEQTTGSYKRQVHLKFSDMAIDKAGQYLARYIQPWPPGEVKGPGAEVPQTAPALESGLESVEAETTPASTPTVQSAQQPMDKYSWIDSYIFRNDDRLEIKLVDFKGSTKAEQKRRMILLYTWGYDRHFNQPVPSRKHITQLAREKKLWDTALSHQITRMKDDMLIEGDDGSIRLAPGAAAEVDQILAELQNRELKGYDYQTTKTARKKSRRGRKSKATLEAIQSQVEQWLANGVDLAGFDPRELQNALSRQKVQFTLWVLRKTHRVESAPPDAVVKYATRAFPTMGGTEQSLKNSVANCKYVGRTPQGELFLTPDGEQDIEVLLSGALKNS
jgi:hypothetical protein